MSVIKTADFSSDKAEKAFKPRQHPSPFLYFGILFYDYYSTHNGVFYKLIVKKMFSVIV
jgi:hypothetical protein